MESEKDERSSSAKVSFSSTTSQQLGSLGLSSSSSLSPSVKRNASPTNAAKRTSLSTTESSFLSAINKSFAERSQSLKRSSLTIDEAEVLESVDKAYRRLSSENSLGKLQASSSNEYEDDDDEDDGVEPEFTFVPHISYRNARETLRKSIARHKGRLSVAEVEFLHCVADSDAVETVLIRANDVLINDMHTEKKMEEEEKKQDDGVVEEGLEPKEGHQRGRSSLVARSFRIEMHRNLLCAPDDSTITEEEEESFLKVESHHVHFAQDEEFSPFLMFTFNRPSLSSLSDMLIEDEEKSKRTDRHTVASIPEEEEVETAAATTGKIDFLILGASDEPKDIQNSVLSPPLMHALRRFLPYIVQEDNFWLKYSLVRDGASIEAFLDKVKYSDRVILAVETADGEVFGSFTSKRFQAQGERFYGTGEAFLWRLTQPRTTECATLEDRVALESDVEVFRWSNQNMNVQLSNPRKIAIGGGVPEDIYSGEQLVEGKDDEDNWTFGLVMNSDMSIGTSGQCATFNSPCLSKISEEGSFKIINVEAWTLTPVNAIDQAERLEMARHFVIDTAELNKFP